MQIVTLSKSGTILKKVEESLAMRIAFLLGQTATIAGSNLYELVEKRDGISQQQVLAELHFKDKIEFVENYCQDNGVSGINFIKLKELDKHFAKTKFKSNKQIAAFKTMEKSVLKIFNGIVDSYEKMLESSGIYEMSHLIDEDVVQTFACDISNLEQPNHEQVKASEILNLNFSPDEKKIFILSSSFFETSFAASFKPIDINDANAAIEGTVYSKLLFKIPNINYLKAAELKLIRNSINNERNSFCETADEWINMCYKSENFELRKEILNTELYPSAIKMSESINCHDNIKHLTVITQMEQTIEVFIGEIPFQLLLDYHSHYKIIQEETIAQMKILQENDERFNGRWPVILFKLANGDNANDKNIIDSGEGFSSAKKSIIID